MTDVLGRAEYQLGASLEQLKRDLSEAKGLLRSEGETAEREANDRLTRSSAKWGSIAKAGVLALSGAASVAFGAVARGAVEMENAQASFRAETGASAEEAKRFGQAVNDMSAHNVQSLEEIVAAGTKVRTDLGLTGDEADATTRSFLAYARATSQDTSRAVLAFDDILDAWNLTAADSQGIMDLLVASHQRYGGSVEDNQAALAALAAPMRAANLSYEDGIGLLNLFAASGLDAAAAPAALTKALGKVKSPEQLQALIADISATEDPFQRAAKAADLFGAKAGAKLGSALAGKAIEDFTVSVDEAAGSTDKARAALDSTFGTQFKLLMGEAGAAVRGLGMEFGPAGSLLMAVTSAGPLLAGPMRALGGLIGVNVVAGMVPKVVAGLLGAVGIGGALSAAALVSAGIVVAIPVALILNKDVIDRLIQDVTNDVSKALGGSGNVPLTYDWKPPTDQIGSPETADANMAGADAIIARRRAEAAAAAYLASWDAAWKRKPPTSPTGFLEEAIARGEAIKAGRAVGEAAASGVGEGWTLVGDAVLVNGIPRAREAAERIAQESVAAMIAGYSQNVTQDWDPAYIRIMQDSHIKAMNRQRALLGVLLPGAFSPWPKAAEDAGEEAGENLWHSMVLGLAQGERPVKAAMADLRWALENPLAAIKLRSRIEGALTGEQLAKGLRSRRPWIREEAERAKAELIRQWELATGRAWDHGLSINENLGRGMKRNRHRPREEARETAAAVSGPLGRLPAAAYTDGQRVTSQFAAGIASRTAEVTGAAEGLGKALHGQIHQSSPAKEGPLSRGGGTFGWGAKAGTLFAQGLLTAQGNVRTAAATVLSPLASLAGLGGPSFSIAASAIQTVRHEGIVRHQVELSGATIAAARAQGATWDDVGRMAGAANLSDVLAAAGRQSGQRYSGRRS